MRAYLISLLATISQCRAQGATLAPVATISETFTPIPSELVVSHSQGTLHPPATVLNTFTPVPSETFLATNPLTVRPTTSNQPSAAYQTVVDLLLGDTYFKAYGPLGAVVGSIIAVDATATTYQVECSPSSTSSSSDYPHQYIGCRPTDKPITITQGPATVDFTLSVNSPSFTKSYTENCTLAAGTLLSCIITETAIIVHEPKMSTMSSGPVTDIKTYTHVYTKPQNASRTHYGDYPPYFAVPITAGIEKIASAEASKTSTSSASISSGLLPLSSSTSTGNTTAGSGQPSGGGGWRGDMCATLLVLAGIACCTLLLI